MKTRKKLLWGFLWLTVLVYSAGIIYAAAPAHRNFFKAVTARTIDNEATGTAGYDSVDAIICVYSDTGSAAVIAVSGYAWFDPGDKLYIGFGNDSANMVSATSLIANNNLIVDSFIYPSYNRGNAHLPFSLRYCFAPGAAATDTFFLNMATAGNSTRENVEIQACYLTGTVGLR